MSLAELVRSCRSIRRYQQDIPIEMTALEGLVEVARLAPSGGNLQSLRYALCADPAVNARVFPHLKWAGYLKDWDGPADGERPAGYVVMLQDPGVTRNPWADPGIACQTLVLAAAEQGLGACILGSVDRPALRDALSLPEGLEILFVIALGHPAEIVRIDPLGPDGDIRYWRDEAGVHHVPKRALDELIVARDPASAGPRGDRSGR